MPLSASLRSRITGRFAVGTMRAAGQGADAMIGRRRMIGVLAVTVGALALGGCGDTDRLRYRMTVEVETPQGTRSGSAVREVSHFVPWPIPSIGESREQWRVKGEAVAVDLQDGKTLFAVLSGEKGDPNFSGGGVWWLFRQIRGRQIELWPNAPVTNAPRVKDPRPLLVTFTDIADPASVRRVDPADLAASFGPGVRLKRITVSITDDPVTTGIEKRLRWLPRVYEILKGTAFRPEGVPVGDYRGLFTTKEFQ